MITQRETALAAASLAETARQAGLEFEASPTGLWLRVALTTGAVYLVQEPFAPGCTLLETTSGLSRRLHYFPDVAEAVRVVKEHVQPQGAQGATGAGESFWLGLAPEAQRQVP